jgi:hypothetical protein
MVPATWWFTRTMRPLNMNTDTTLTRIRISEKLENKEITPVIGLFGTMAGHVPGRSDGKEAGRETNAVPVK